MCERSDKQVRLHCCPYCKDIDLPTQMSSHPVLVPFKSRVCIPAIRYQLTVSCLNVKGK